MHNHSTATYWPLTDQQGTVRDLYQGSTHNSISDHISFDAFGKPSAVSSLVQFLYVGQQYDNETGLQYSRARYYDPAAQRFISQDPISFAAGDANLDNVLISAHILKLKRQSLGW